MVRAGRGPWVRRFPSCRHARTYTCFHTETPGFYIHERESRGCDRGLRATWLLSPSGCGDQFPQTWGGERRGGA